MCGILMGKGAGFHRDLNPSGGAVGSRQEGHAAVASLADGSDADCLTYSWQSGLLLDRQELSLSPKLVKDYKNLLIQLGTGHAISPNHGCQSRIGSRVCTAI